jgi:hypothetical protein
MEEQVTSSNIEIGAVTTLEGKFRLYSKDELERIIADLAS